MSHRSCAVAGVAGLQVLGNLDDLVPLDGDIADGRQFLRWVDDLAALDDEIVRSIGKVPRLEQALKTLRLGQPPAASTAANDK